VKPKIIVKLSASIDINEAEVVPDHVKIARIM